MRWAATAISRARAAYAAVCKRQTRSVGRRQRTDRTTTTGATASNEDDNGGGGSKRPSSVFVGDGPTVTVMCGAAGVMARRCAGKGCASRRRRVAHRGAWSPSVQRRMPRDICDPCWRVAGIEPTDSAPCVTPDCWGRLTKVTSVRARAPPPPAIRTAPTSCGSRRRRHPRLQGPITTVSMVAVTWPQPPCKELVAAPRCTY